MWTIDPIDGTKGFLRGEQYAVCLALLVDAQVQVGVIGCPNLYVDASNPDGERGCIFVAVKGQGTQQVPDICVFLFIYLNSITQINLSGGTPIPLSIPPLPSTLRFLESVEAAHSNHGINDQVSAKLGNTASSIRMDSQAKYACLARGDGGIYMRVKTNDDTYEERIWDHAAGSLLVQEAGGIVTDGHGKTLDFGVGRTLKHNAGIVGAGRDIHPKAIQALSEIWSQAVAKA
jgi:3'(2'), 5'-bisphosphate nucleotidase